MTSRSVAWRRKLKAVERDAHGLWQILKAVVSTDHPLLAHLIPIRRCNLACTYCNEFDDFSKPVPTDLMLRRVDLLGDLGTSVVTISGGEPLLHPQLDDIIHRMRQRRIVSGLITNGYLLTADRIQRLNRAGLEWLQISIDNVNPDEVSKKSLKVLDRKLQLLAEHADFHVNINSVVGSGVSHPEDALTIGKRALELGFSSTVGIIHDGSGQVQPLNDEERRVYHERGRAGALLLAAARVSGDSAGEIHDCRFAPRVPDGEAVRAALHGIVRAPDIGAGCVAGTAAAGVGAGERTGAY